VPLSLFQKHIFGDCSRHVRKKLITVLSSSPITVVAAA
jgi:hypothetical protein